MPATDDAGAARTTHVEHHRSGTVRARGLMVDGQPDGYWEWFRTVGTLLRSGSFERGRQVGEWTTYDRDGEVYRATTPGDAAPTQPVSARTPLAQPSLHLPRPVVNALAAANVTTLGAAWSMTDPELLALHGVGPKGVRMSASCRRGFRHCSGSARKNLRDPAFPRKESLHRRKRQPLAPSALRATV